MRKIELVVTSNVHFICLFSPRYIHSTKVGRTVMLFIKLKRIFNLKKKKLEKTLDDQKQGESGILINYRVNYKVSPYPIYHISIWSLTFQFGQFDPSLFSTVLIQFLPLLSIGCKKMTCQIEQQNFIFLAACIATSN